MYRYPHIPRMGVELNFPQPNPTQTLIGNAVFCVNVRPKIYSRRLQLNPTLTLHSNSKFLKGSRFDPSSSLRTNLMTLGMVSFNSRGQKCTEMITRLPTRCLGFPITVNNHPVQGIYNK